MKPDTNHRGACLMHAATHAQVGQCQLDARPNYAALLVQDAEYRDAALHQKLPVAIEETASVRRPVGFTAGRDVKIKGNHSDKGMVGAP